MNNLDKNAQAIKKIGDAYIQIFDVLKEYYGLDWKNDENFNDTPQRIGRAIINERCKGINSEKKCKQLLKNVTFPSNYKGFVIINPVTAFSLCPHHFESISYIVSTAYIPKNHVIGLSKIPRVIKLFAAQPILQEDFTKKLTDIIEDSINPEALGVVVKGRHNCMIARGIQDPNVFCTTSEVRGTCLTDPAVKGEFLRLCGI